MTVERRRQLRPVGGKVPTRPDDTVENWLDSGVGSDDDLLHDPARLVEVVHVMRHNDENIRTGINANGDLLKTAIAGQEMTRERAGAAIDRAAEAVTIAGNVAIKQEALDHSVWGYGDRERGAVQEMRESVDEMRVMFANINRNIWRAVVITITVVAAPLIVAIVVGLINLTHSTGH